MGNSPIKFYYTNTSGTNFVLGGFSSNGNFNITGSYSPPSDIRIKKNIENYKTDIEKFKKISIKKFDRIDIDKKNQIGVIAQEIKEVYPDIIEIGTQLNDDNVKDFHFIKPDNLIYHLISVVQQLTERIEVLENKRCI